MSRNRLLDVAALFQATRGVAAEVLTLRKGQWENYNKTSSLTHAVRQQGGRLARTVHGATKPWPSTGLSSLRNASNQARSRAQSSAKDEDAQKAKARSTSWQTRRTDQDHDFPLSEHEATRDHLSRSGVEGSQKEVATSPISDNDKSSSATGSQLDDHQAQNSSSLDARKLQWQAERQIPSQAAEPPPSSTEGPDETVEGIFVEQEQDIFFRPPPKSGPVLSALPRVKLPKNGETSQRVDEHLSEHDMNLDVFHQTSDRDAYRLHSQSLASSPPEGTYAGLFQSPKIARMLSGEPTSSGSPNGSDTSGKEQDHSSRSNDVQDEVKSSDAPSNREADDLRTLVSDIANDTSSTDSTQSQQGHQLSEETPPQAFEMRESRVPSSRFGRLWQYGGLATSMAFGAVGEGFRRATSYTPTQGSIVLSANNMERLVAKLSKMRGAALKLGQMMSFQDSKMLPKPIHEVLRRVQDSADFMPSSQRNKVLAENLGTDWQKLFSKFDEKPIAAASIGQVHKGTLRSSGKDVAIKIQYPGVASSINSDLSNLALLLTASKLLPKGLYLDKTIANARTELAWECDYLREAAMGSRFRELLQDETSTFFVPSVIAEASGPQVLTAELCGGTAITKLVDASQTQKDWMGTNILRLCLREITEFKFMQTDPNWTNFLYNRQTQKLELLDFGAAREYPDEFIVPYVKLLLAASHSDRDAVRDLSIQLGYLTGHESRTMVNAHVDSVLTLAEPFMETAPDTYDFRNQTITDRVRGLIPVMLRERLSPPPEETYSLHRKLSGAFLLCARLGSNVRCREMFQKAIGRVGMM